MPHPPEQTAPAPKHFAWLDWMRFLAAFVVLFGHTRFQHFSYYEKLEIPGKGRLTEAIFLLPRFANEAVMVFFVLSGFLVGGRCLERIIKNSFDPKGYAIDRATRIWLPLIPTVCVTWIVAWIRDGSVTLWEGLGNIASVQGIFVKPMANNLSLWSLSYEVWFYVLALGVALVATPRRHSVKLFGVIVATVSMAVFIPLEACYLFVWLTGALAYMLPRDGTRNGLLIGGTIFATVSLLVAAMGTTFRSIDISWLTAYLPPREVALVALGLGVSLTLPVLVAKHPKQAFARKFEAWGSSLAASSYSLYLIHRPILELWAHFEGNQTHDQVNASTILLFVTKMAVCMLGGWLFYLAFEKHTAFVRRKLTGKRQAVARDLPQPDAAS